MTSDGSPARGTATRFMMGPAGNLAFRNLTRHSRLSHVNAAVTGSAVHLALLFT
jgi:hypothetical protein